MVTVVTVPTMETVPTMVTLPTMETVVTILAVPTIHKVCCMQKHHRNNILITWYMSIFVFNIIQSIPDNNSCIEG